MVTIIDPHIKREGGYHIHEVSSSWISQSVNKSVSQSVSQSVWWWFPLLGLTPSGLFMGLIST